jgi:hypothetical protein
MFLKINGETYHCENFFELMRILEQGGWKIESPPGAMEFILMVAGVKMHAIVFSDSYSEQKSKNISELHKV